MHVFPDDVYEPESAFDKLDLSHIDEDLREPFRAALKARRRAFCRQECLPPACKAAPIKLVLKPGAGQPAVMKQRAWSPAVREQHEYHEQRRLKYGTAVVIKETTPYERRAEPLLVWKPDNTTRQVIDASLINPQLVTDTYPIPLIPEQIAKLHGFQRGSKFDLAEGFVQCALHPDSWVHAMWRATVGSMASTRLLAGLSPAPGNFCRIVKENLVDRLPLGYRERTAHYFDDLAHGSPGVDRNAQIDELAYVLAYLDACIEGDHTNRLQKCRFAELSISFAGMELRQGTKRPLPERVASIVNFGPIVTKKDLGRLVSMGEPWRASIKGFFTLAEPLRAAARGRGPLAKPSELEFSIEKFRAAFAKMAFATIPNLSKGFEFYVDTGDTATAYIIEQEGAFVACGGRFLTSRERVMSPYDREWLGYVNALEKSEPLIGGAFAKIFGDHESLQGLGSSPSRETQRDMSGHRPDFMERSLRFRYSVSYLPRDHPKMVAVDAITRSPEFRGGEISDGITESPIVSIHAVVSAFAALTATAPERTSAALWRRRQLRDDQYGTLIKFMEQGILPLSTSKERARGFAAQASHYQLVDGALYHISVRRGVTNIQLAIPDVDSFRLDRIKAAHEVDSVHEGPKKMFERLSLTFHWDNMLADCIAFYTRCDLCKANTPINNNYGLLDPTTSSKLDGNDRLGLDLAGPFPKTERGNTFIGIAANYRSGRVITFPLRDKENPTIIEALRIFYVPFMGVPDQIVTDRAPEFHADLPQAFYKAFGIEKLTSTGGHPQTDGLAEAGVKMAKQKVRILVQVRKSDWDLCTGDVNMSMASEFKLPNGMSPFKAETGREYRSPSFFEYPLGDLGVDHPSMKDLEVLHKKLAEARDAAAAKMKERYDVGRVPAPFKEGDLVWLRNQDPDGTLDVKRLGPFRVKEMVSDLAARLVDIPQGPKMGRRHPVVSVNDIDTYEGKLVSGDSDNYRPSSILKHKMVPIGKKGRKVKRPRYLVQWSDGSSSWEPSRNLVDEDSDGIVITEVLDKYWSMKPDVRKRDIY
jgi:hypothetical protein